MRRIATLVVLIAIAQPTWAGFDGGMASAAPGVARAQSHPGTSSLNSRTVPPNPAEAVKWYRRAAQGGNVLAQVILGLMYDRGEGVAQDDAEAMKWYLMAAEQGHAVAQNNLGVMFERGRGAPRDNVQALKWYTIAAARAPASEKARHDGAVKNRDLLAAKMTPAQVAEAQKLAREWMAAFARGGVK